MRRRQVLMLPLVAAVGLVIPHSPRVYPRGVVAFGFPLFKDCDYQDIRSGRLTEQQAEMFHCLKPGERYVELTGIRLKALGEIQARFAEGINETLAAPGHRELLRISSLTAGSYDGDTWARFMIEESA